MVLALVREKRRVVDIKVRSRALELVLKGLKAGKCHFTDAYLSADLQISSEKKYEIVIFDNGFRKGFGKVEEFNDKVTLVKGDVLNIHDWKKLPNDIDQVFHLAAINGTKYFYDIPDKVLEANVIGTFNCFKWI